MKFAPSIGKEDREIPLTHYMLKNYRLRHTYGEIKWKYKSLIRHAKQLIFDPQSAYQDII